MDGTTSARLIGHIDSQPSQAFRLRPAHHRAMTFEILALVCLVGLIGPLPAVPATWRIPVVVSELLGGLVVGASGAGWLDADDETFRFLAELGFAMTMFVAGTGVPIPERDLRSALAPGLGRGVLVGLAAACLGAVLGWLFDSRTHRCSAC
jgi:Kef-type K+ transport system membrane component KefB